MIYFNKKQKYTQNTPKAHTKTYLKHTQKHTYRLQQAQEELDTVLANLKEKTEKLSAVEAEIKILQGNYDHSVEDKLSLTRNIVLTQTRLRRAGKLITALMSEKSRWEDSVEVRVVWVALVGDEMFCGGGL